MVQWSKSSTLDRKVKGSKLAANSYFEQTTKTREKDETNLETNKKEGTPAKRTTIDAWSKRARNVSLDPKLLSVNEKGLDSKDVD